MGAETRIIDTAKAMEYFEAKIAYTTGLVELERMMRQGEIIKGIPPEIVPIFVRV